MILLFSVCFKKKKKKTGPQKQHNTSPHFELFMLNFISYQNLGRRNYTFAQELVVLLHLFTKLYVFNAPKKQKTKQKIYIYNNQILADIIFIFNVSTSPKTKQK